MAFTPIDSLFFFRRPTTVVGRVIAIVVNAVDAVKTAWSSPHVGEEIYKFTPTLANDYAAFTIVFIADRFRISTPSMHVGPNGVFRCFASELGFTMLVLSFCGLFSEKTSTRLNTFKSTAAGSKFYSPTIANIKPPLSFNPQNDGQPSKTLTYNIDGHSLLLQRAVVSSGDRVLPTLGCRAILAGYSNG
jgi:hypothetical protein